MLIPLVNCLCCRRAPGRQAMSASITSPSDRPWMMRASCAPTPARFSLLFYSASEKMTDYISLDFSILCTHVLIFGTHVGRRWFGSSSNLVFFLYEGHVALRFFSPSKLQSKMRATMTKDTAKLLRRSSSSNNRGTKIPRILGYSWAGRFFFTVKNDYFLALRWHRVTRAVWQ